jgi:hypothetical protein
MGQLWAIFEHADSIPVVIAQKYVGENHLAIAQHIPLAGLAAIDSKPNNPVPGFCRAGYYYSHMNVAAEG